MESTYLYYPAPKVYRILSGTPLIKRGYRIMNADEQNQTIIFQKKQNFFRSLTLELKIQPANESITFLAVKRIDSALHRKAGEKEIIEEILKIF